MESKVYDYAPDKVRTKIADVFKSRRGEATVADLVAVTGLPKIQIDEQLPAVSDEFGARLKVTESGEILYSFPSGMKSRYKGFLPSLKRFWKGFKAAAVKTLTFLFKAWIVVMLVGYFVLFIAIAVLAIVLSFAASMAGNQGDNRSSSRRGGGLMGFAMVGRLFDVILRIWLYSAVIDDMGGGRYRREARRERGKKRPLHHAIFSFIFGDGDPNADRANIERRAVIAFLQTHKGVITADEFMAITGMPSAEAEIALNRYMVEFEGEPRVSDEGTIYYAFETIMRGRRPVESPYGAESASLPPKQLRRFSINPAKSNGWYSAFNGVNLLFGSYFLYSASVFGNPGPLFQIIRQKMVLIPGFDLLYRVAGELLRGIGIADSTGILFVGLGIVPLAFSLLFYLVPALRYARLRSENERIKTDNLRTEIYRNVYAKPEEVIPGSLPRDAAAPKKAGLAEERIVAQLAAAREADVTVSGGRTAYSFAEIARAQADIAKVRAGIDASKFDIGGTVFDSGSK